MEVSEHATKKGFLVRFRTGKSRTTYTILLYFSSR